MPAQNLPTRLHHNAYVTNDMKATRHFYEDVIGMPLIATWCEVDELFGAERVYCHCFFGLADESALAFFQFAKQEDQELFGPKIPFSPFQHIALNCDASFQEAAHKRLVAAGFKEPQMFVLEHGYCKSLYATDPNGMILELTVDNAAALTGASARQASAHADLERWLGGDHTSNNTWR